MIDFNRPYLTGDEEKHIFEAVRNGKISGNGKHTNLCQDFFQNRFGFNKALLTTSCTDALEMSALLSNIQEGDEVIDLAGTRFIVAADSFDFLRGCSVEFTDSLSDRGFKIFNPNAARSCGCGTSFEPSEEGKKPEYDPALDGTQCK